MPIFCPLLLHKLYMQFGSLAEAGRYEKCKKHTFLALITIFLKNAINKNCSEFNKKIFWEKFFSWIPDPDFGPDSTFSGFSKFFESIAYIKHLYRRIFELYQIVVLWTGMYYITSPLCKGHSNENLVYQFCDLLSHF